MNWHIPGFGKPTESMIKESILLRQAVVKRESRLDQEKNRIRDLDWKTAGARSVAMEKLNTARHYVRGLDREDIERDAEQLFDAKQTRWSRVRDFVKELPRNLKLAAAVTATAIKRLPSARATAALFVVGAALTIAGMHVGYFGPPSWMTDGVMWTGLSMNYARIGARGHRGLDGKEMSRHQMRGRLFYEEARCQVLEHSVAKTHEKRREAERTLRGIDIFGHKCEAVVEHEREMDAKSGGMLLKDAIAQADIPAVEEPEIKVSEIEEPEIDIRTRDNGLDMQSMAAPELELTRGFMS